MSSLHLRMQEIWYGGRKPGPLLRALSVLYGAVVRLRRMAYRRDWLRVQRVNAPVIVVGNRVVGGSGKTPFVIALVEHLCARGWSPGVVSRGYGRRSRKQVVVDANTDARDGGDEPVLIARRTGVPVVVDADRVAAARRAIELGADIVVADDGLQHYRLHRDLEIEVLDAGRRYGNVLLLPAGPLREPLFGIDRKWGMRITNGTDEQTYEMEEGPEYHFHLVGDVLMSANGQANRIDGWRGRRVHAVAGIGNPRRFFDSLREHGLDPVQHAFADHHAYNPTDLAFEEKLPIVMTEKDWVKCAVFAPADAWMLPVRAECSEGLLDSFYKLFVYATGQHRD